MQSSGPANWPAADQQKTLNIKGLIGKQAPGNKISRRF